jgi:hypothetical protein
MSSSNVYIAVLDRGWIFVGHRENSPKDSEGVANDWRLTNCYCIRRWGTTKGLGEIAIDGPLEESILDKSNDLFINDKSVIFWMVCDSEIWNKYLLKNSE